MLSENDWKRVSQALQAMEELTLTRTLGKEEVTVCVARAGKAWLVAVIVSIQYKSPHLDWSQNFESVETARRAWEERRT